MLTCNGASQGNLFRCFAPRKCDGRFATFMLQREKQTNEQRDDGDDAQCSIRVIQHVAALSLRNHDHLPRFREYSLMDETFTLAPAGELHQFFRIPKLKSTRKVEASPVLKQPMVRHRLGA